MIREKILSYKENINGTVSAVATSRNINVVYGLLVAVGVIVTIASINWATSSFELCQKDYMKASQAVVSYNQENPEYKLPIPQYNCMIIEDKEESMGGVVLEWTASGAIVPHPERQGNKVKELTLRDRFGLWDCRFTNSFHRIGRYNLEWMAYDIACTPWVAFDVKSPWEYTIEKIGYWHNMGNYIILKKSSEVWDEVTRIVLAHIVSPLEVWAKLGEWSHIWRTDLSGESTWMHVHIELWSGYMNVSREFALGEEYTAENGTSLLNHRKWDFGQPKDNVYYFTSYNLWDVNQNDSTPCIWASWKDLCQLEASWVRTMALTSDIRKKLGIEFWDKVKLTWEEGCSWVFEVHDEMNKRFRATPWVLRPWTSYYIKGDLPSKSGGVCHVEKI